MRGRGLLSRQATRESIVQQWDPLRATNSPRAPITPPEHDQDHDLEDDGGRVVGYDSLSLDHKMALEAERNGIERPQGYTVSYHYNPEVEGMHFGRHHPMKPWRLTLTKHLVMGYGLQYAFDPFLATPASKEDLLRFHKEDYIEFLSHVSPSNFPDLERNYSKYVPKQHHPDEEDPNYIRIGPFNLSNSQYADCPVFDGMSKYITLYTGASLSAARKLCNNQSDIAINWSGGLHHAQKGEASGFCYVNDIVLAIQEMCKFYQRVLYIDIDVHHGDGVEQAFASTERVMTLSFHRHGMMKDEKGKPTSMFFPGTGDVTDTGPKHHTREGAPARGAHFSLNVPCGSGISDDQYIYLFENITGRVLEKYRPEAIVLQCGADSLGGDRLGSFNLNIRAHGSCVSFVKRARVPLLLLGGGGYTARNVARAWTHETALAVGATLHNDLPMHILPRPQAFEGRPRGDAKLYPELSKAYDHKNENDDREIRRIIERIYYELGYVDTHPVVLCPRYPGDEVIDDIVAERERELQDRWKEEAMDRDAERKKRERNTGVRGELR
ncbi:histone deacetylase [Elasticomyces elasticus]|nr:histone deacetylase [Elasticomyces elasticus]